MVESKEDVLLKSLKKFYAEPEHLRVLTDVLRNQTKVSLRTLDWLVTNYSKKKNIAYTHKNDLVNVYLEYKGCLKAFSKRCFDPFQRRQRISLKDADSKTIQSTVGQLNFFRFAISRGIIQYALNHLEDIESDMMQSIKSRNSSQPGDKRKELSKAAIKTATSTDIQVTVRFK